MTHFITVLATIKLVFVIMWYSQLNADSSGVWRCVNTFVLNRLPRSVVMHFDQQYGIMKKISHNNKWKQRNSHLRTILIEIGALKQKKTTFEQ